MILNEFFNLPQVFEKDMEEGIFGSKPNPVLPIVAKIDKVARELNPQNVEVGKQIIQSQTRDITRILSPQDKAGVDVIEQDELEEVDRRGFLKGLGAAAVAGAAGGAKAEQLNIEPLMTSTDGSVTIVFVSRPGKAVNGWLALKKRNGQWSPQTNDPAGGIKIDGNKVITVGFDFVNTNPRIGRDEAGPPDYSLANMNGIDYIHPIKTASKQILMNLKQIGGGIVEFNPRSTKESVEQGVAEAKDDYVPPKEADYGYEYQQMVRRVGQKAKQQEKAKQQQPKAPVRESRLALLKQIIQS